MESLAILAKADGNVEVVDFDESNSYNTIKEATGGGLIDRVHMSSLDVDVWIDDEGKLVENPTPNSLGTVLWVNEYGMTDFICGDIIITGGVDDEGNTLGLSREKVFKVLDTVTQFILKRKYPEM